MNSTILFTGYDSKMEPLAKLTVPLMEQYAKRHGWDFCAHKVAPAGLNIYWTGVSRAIQHLEESRVRRCVVYLDVDQMITNMDHELHLQSSGFHVSTDWGYDAEHYWQFSMCGFVAHEDSLPLFYEALRIEPQWRDKDFQEQAPMQHILKTSKELGKLMTVHPRKKFNSVPDDVCPGKVPEPWQPGDWQCHLTMVDIPKRIELFHRISSLIK